MKESTNNVNTHEVISQLAYALWEKAGRPSGQDLEFWLQAEAQLLEEQKKQAAKPAVVLAETQAFQASQRVTSVKINNVSEPKLFDKKLSKSRRK